MRPASWILSIAALTGACTPLDIYYQQGTSVQRAEADTTQCQVHALKEAPVVNQIRREPPEFIPPREVCDSQGNCRHYGGYWVPGEVYTIDVNRGLRKRVEAQCMAARGYVPAEIPRCPPGVKATGRTTVLPPLSENSCAIKNDDGSYLIVDRT